MVFEEKRRGMWGILVVVAACSGAAKDPEVTSGGISDAGSGSLEESSLESSSGTLPESGGSGGTIDGGGSSSLARARGGFDVGVIAVCDDPALTAVCATFKPFSNHWPADAAQQCGACYFADIQKVCEAAGMPLTANLPGTPNDAACWLFGMVENCQYNTTVGEAPLPLQIARSYDELVANASAFCAPTGNCAVAAVQSLGVALGKCTLP